MGECEIVGPETRIFKIENRGFGTPTVLTDQLSWVDIERHLNTLENKTLTIFYKDIELKIDGHRTRESYVPWANIDPDILVPKTFRMVAFTGSNDNLIVRLMPKVGRTTLEHARKLLKEFYQTGSLSVDFIQPV